MLSSKQVASYDIAWQKHNRLVDSPTNPTWAAPGETQAETGSGWRRVNKTTTSTTTGNTQNTDILYCTAPVSSDAPNTNLEKGTERGKDTKKNVVVAVENIKGAQCIKQAQHLNQ